MTQRRLAPLRSVLIDTSAYFALFDLDDDHHPRALTILDGIVSHGWYVIVTSFIVAETHALLLNRLGYRVATQFLRDMEHTTTTVEWVTPGDIERARQIIYQYDDKRFSLTDASSFALMERLHIPYAFTFDRDFAQYGLTALSPAQFS